VPCQAPAPHPGRRWRKERGGGSNGSCVEIRLHGRGGGVTGEQWRWSQMEGHRRGGEPGESRTVARMLKRQEKRAEEGSNRGRRGGSKAWMGDRMGTKDEKEDTYNPVR
jgi:hypothetical protein